MHCLSFPYILNLQVGQTSNFVEFSSENSSQVNPPYIGSGCVHVLYQVLVQLPMTVLLLQSDTLFHSDHPPLTVKQLTQFIILLLF
jgi:hypothetical protein